jgi:CRISPR-associated endonuclease Csn1
MSDEIVWAFDLGKASIGEAVRQGTKFLHKASLLIPPDFAETRTAANRRRMWRTRQAHHARERWLEQVWSNAGLEVLYGRNRHKQTGEWKAGEPGDERLEREFPAQGDHTCYTSCLLRIKLLRGEKLEAWQIFKALHSAIQKRGYGKIPWAEKEARRAGKSVEELEKEEQKKDSDYVAAVNKWREFKVQVPECFQFPAYYDAFKMGLWNPSEADSLRPRTTHAADSTRNIRFDRTDVEREIKQLADNAAKQLDPLRLAFVRFQAKGWNQIDPATGRERVFSVTAESFGEFLCYGPAGVPYASFLSDTRQIFGLHQGSTDDWMGVLGQKIPRFDNRILNDCVLIPRFHVCKTDIRQDRRTGKPFPETLLAAEVTFLMKLRNTLVADGPGQRKLRVEEIQRIFEAVSADVAKVKPDAKDWSKKIADRLSLTKTDWGKTKGIAELELRPLPGHETVKPPRDSGRSGFSRPALRFLKELILSGKSPREFHSEQLANLNGNSDRKQGLTVADLKFLLDMGDSWDNIHIPTQKLEALAARHTQDGELEADEAVADLLGGINDPVVRHRLSVLAQRLRAFSQRFGKPDEIVLEFVREDFMGPKRKAELLQFQRDRERARKEAREQARAAGAEEKSAPLKYELAKEQGGLCLYCGQPFSMARLDDYDIDHIVPRSKGGPDAIVNSILAHRACNEDKDEQTPFQWKYTHEGWDAYKALVEKHATTLRNKKVQLLLREDAPGLVDRYTALAETAWVSKLAQTIVCLFFGWKNGNDDKGCKRVTIVSGGLTARIRRKYRLNSLLNPCPAGEDPLLWEERCEKNRDDARHHALDAMVISFIPGWARDRTKEQFFRFPPGFRDSEGRENYRAVQQFFKELIANVIPENFCFLRPALDQTIYGARRNGSGAVAVKRERLLHLGFKSPAPGKLVFNLPTLRKGVENICDKRIRECVAEFVASSPDEAAWREFCAGLKQSKKDGTSGARIELVTVAVGDIEEYSDLSKDGNGAWRRGATHRGFLVALDGEHAGTARPVYAFEPLSTAKSDFRERVGASTQVHFLESGCAVSLSKVNIEATPEMQSGRYIFTSISNKRTIKFRDAAGQACRSSVKSAVAAGLGRS